MAYPKETCIRGHARAVYGYRDTKGRQRCHECDELIKRGPLTGQRRRPRGTTDAWKRISEARPEVVQRALEQLPERERRFISLRLGVDRGKARTGREVSEITGFTRQWISSVTVPALATLVSVIEEIEIVTNGACVI